MIELTPITDPNQLTLGIENEVLTVEQQQSLERMIHWDNKSAQDTYNALLNQRALLLGAGFTEDEFIFEAEQTVEKKTYNLAGWRDPEVLVEADINVTRGKCVIKYNEYRGNTGKIEEAYAYFNVERGHKVTCSTLVNSYRAVKVETLKRKVAEKNQNAIYNKERYEREHSVTNKTVEKYAKLCPTATVTSTSTWHMNRNRKVIRIEFPNGSVMEIETGWEFGRESILRFVDTKTSKLDPEQLAAYFNAQ